MSTEIVGVSQSAQGVAPNAAGPCRSVTYKFSDAPSALGTLPERDSVDSSELQDGCKPSIEQSHPGKRLGERPHKTDLSQIIWEDPICCDNHYTQGR